MALNALGMGIIISGRDAGASAALRKVKREMGDTSEEARRLEQQMDKAKRGIKTGAAMMATGVGTLVAVNKATKAFGEFEFVLASAAGKMRDGTENLEALKQVAFKAGKLTQFSPQEAAQGLAELGAQGLTAKESMAALFPVLNLAAGSMGQLGVGEAAGVAMSALNAFGKTVKDLPDVVNKLTVVSDSSAFQMRDFQVAIAQAAAQAKAGQQSFEDMLATLALLRDAGNEASSAATAYREAVRRVAGDQRAIRKMRELGVRAVDKETKRMKSLSAIIAELHPRLQKLGVQERARALQVIFGVRGMKTYNAVIAAYEKNLAKGTARTGQFTVGTDILLKRLGASHGVAAKKVQTALATTGGQYRLLKGSWETFVIKFGELFAKHVVPVLKKLIDLLNGAVDFITGMSPAVKTLVSHVVTWGGVLLTVVGGLKILKGALAVFTLGRLAGQFVAAQVAATGATQKLGAAAQTTGAQVDTATKKTSRFGRAMGALGRFAGGALTLAAYGVAAYGVGKVLGDFLVKKIWGAKEAALDAKNKFADFRLTFDRFNRTLRRGAGHLGKFRMALMANTRQLVKAASVSTRSAEKVLGKMTVTLGKLSIQRQQALTALFKAQRERDIKGATAAAKKLFEIGEKTGALAEARLEIRAAQYRRQIRLVKDRDKREMMARTIIMSMIAKQDRLEAEIVKKRKEVLAGVRAIGDPAARAEAQLLAEKQITKLEAQRNEGRRRVARQAAKLGLLPTGAPGRAQLATLVKDLRPALRAAGVIGQQSQLFRTNILTAIAKGRGFVTAAGTMIDLTKGLTPERIRAIGQAREAALRAQGIKPAEAAARREQMERLLRRGATGAFVPTTRPTEEAAPERRGLAQLLTPRPEDESLWQNMLGSLQMMANMANELSRSKMTITVSADKTMADAIDVDTKESARGGKRLKIVRTTTGK
jgi:TP901 family phage tail tape measure protein